MAFSPDGMWMVSLHPFGDSVDLHTIRMWDSKSGMLIREVVESGHVSLTLVAISHSGSHVLTYCDSGSFTVRDTFLRTIILHSTRTPILKQPPESVAFSEDDNQIVCTFQSRTVETWDIESGVMIYLSSVDPDSKPGGSETFVY